MSTNPGIHVLAVRVRVLSSATIGRDIGTPSRRPHRRTRFEGCLRKITAWHMGASAHRPAYSLFDAFTFDMQSYVIEYTGLLNQKIIGSVERLRLEHPELAITDEPLEPRLIIVDPSPPHIVILESGPIVKVRVEDQTLAYVETINSVYEVRVLKPREHRRTPVPRAVRPAKAA